MARNWKVEGMKQLERDFKRLGKVPQTIVTQAARAGGRIVLRAAKQNAPEDDGDLKRSLVLKREKRRVRGKTVYDVMHSPHMNYALVKISKEGKRSYYPASQEYGFMTRDGGYVPGYRYLRRAADDNRIQAEKKVLDVAGKGVDKALRR